MEFRALCYSGFSVWVFGFGGFRVQGGFKLRLLGFWEGGLRLSGSRHWKRTGIGLSGLEAPLKGFAAMEHRMEKNTG